MLKFLFNRESIKDEKFNTEVETLRLFCLRKFQDVYACSYEQAYRKSLLMVNSWIKKDVIDKKIKQMWQEKF